MNQDLFRLQPATTSEFSGPDGQSEKPLSFDAELGGNPVSRALATVISTAQPILDFVSQDRLARAEARKVETLAEFTRSAPRQVPISSNIGVKPDSFQIPKSVLIGGVVVLAVFGGVLALKR